MWTWIRSCVPRARRAGGARSRSNRRYSFRFESLEKRCLLACSRVALDPETGVLDISGVYLPESVVVSAEAANIVRVVHDIEGTAERCNFPAAAVRQIVFNGLAGDDNFHNETAIASVANGGDGNDLLVGGQGDDQLSGGSGDDLLNGRGGADHLDGNSHDDRLYGGDGDDSLKGGPGDDQLYGEGGHDVLQGGNGDDLLDGARGNDELFGSYGDDQLFGGDGGDHLDGGRGADELYGNRGDDRLLGGSEADYLDGGDGDDAIDGGTGDDYMLGGEGNDSIQGGAGNDYASGGDGHDSLKGADGADTLSGGGGNDEINGGSSRDRLFGGSGNDELDGSSDQDLLIGGTGGDVLYGGTGSDILLGLDGDDYLDGGVDDDILLGGTGDDHLLGRVGNDLLLGGDGNDSLRGFAGNDVLAGNAGEDSLEGEAGDDVLIGGDGKDVLYGRTGQDLVIGGMTHYDENLSQLSRISELWTSDLTYSERIAALEDSQFTAYLRSEVTVFDDLVADSVFGNEDTDWFFLTGAMPAYTPMPSGETPGHGQSHEHHHHPQQTTANLPPLEGFGLLDALDELDVAVDERIHTVIPHGDDPSKLDEHLALFELIRYDQATHIAVSSGPWSASATWQHGRVPSAGANVLVPVGVEVVVDRVINTELRTVRVDGTLRFHPQKDTELRVDTLGVSAGGLFEMGTAQQPIRADVTARLVIADRGPIDRTWDPYGLSRGLISHGRVSIHGAEKQSHEALAVPPVAGSALLHLLDVPEGWRAGDRIVIPGTDPGGSQDEVREILSVGGKLVWLRTPLEYDHVTPDISLQVHVANLTRNAVIESESQALDRRGHVMFMHHPAVDVRYAGFYHLGRSNKLEVVNDPVVDESWKLVDGTGSNPRGRYAVHFHRNGITRHGHPTVVHGSVVEGSPGWGFVNHSSHVEITENVSYDVDGSGFVTEAGDEIGSFRNNIAIHSQGSGEDLNSRVREQDFGHEGNGFWFQGTGIAVTGNIAAGHPGHAFIFYTRGLNHGHSNQHMFLSENLVDPTLAGGEPMIDTRHVPIREFRDNVGYASEIGLQIRYHMRESPHTRYSTFEKSTFWNNTTGVALPYSHNMVLRNLRIIRAPSLESGTGIDLNLLTENITYDNLTVTGYRRGINVPSRGTIVVRGGFYNNYQNLLVWPAAAPGHSVTVTGNIRFGAFPPDLLGRLSQHEVYVVSPSRSDALTSADVVHPSVILLDYGRYSGTRAYPHAHAADYVPFAEPKAGVPNQYIGLTNRQLWNHFGLQVPGGMIPTSAAEVPGIHGLVWPAPR